MLSGIGVWEVNPTYDRKKVTWTNQTAGIESLVVQQIVKAPKPNNRILVACQDRPNFSIASPTTYATTYNPASGSIQHAGDIVYADDDPTVVFGSSGSSIWRSQDSGQTWVRIATHGVNGCVFAAGMGGACPKLAAPNKLRVVHQDASPNSPLQVGMPTGDPNVGSNWNWTNSRDQSGNPIIGYGYYSVTPTT